MVIYNVCFTYVPAVCLYCSLRNRDSLHKHSMRSIRFLLLLLYDMWTQGSGPSNCWIKCTWNNRTIDFCEFMLRKRNNLSFGKIILDIAFDKSNLNHTCPYDVSSLKIIFYVYWLLFNFYSMTWYFAILRLRKSISSISRYLPVSIRYKLKPAPTTSGKPM